MCEISIEFGLSYTMLKGCQGRDRIEVGFTTTCTISAYHYLSCEFESRSLQGILATALCDKACQWLATVQWFSPVSFINKTNCHVITEILWKVISKTISLTPIYHVHFMISYIYASCCLFLDQHFILTRVHKIGYGFGGPSEKKNVSPHSFSIAKYLSCVSPRQNLPIFCWSCLTWLMNFVNSDWHLRMRPWSYIVWWVIMLTTRRVSPYRLLSPLGWSCFRLERTGFTNIIGLKSAEI
jgi:hypothetical protein